MPLAIGKIDSIEDGMVIIAGRVSVVAIILVNEFGVLVNLNTKLNAELLVQQGEQVDGLVGAIPLLDTDCGNDREVLGEGAIGEDGVCRHGNLCLAFHRVGQTAWIVIIS